MTRNLKMTLFSILCIVISSLLVSYKNFETAERSKQESRQVLNQEVSGWVAESVEQKLSQLEASVSYLDRSTVESLRRFGSRYFAYVYRKNDEWGVKWKVLEKDFGKEQILAEVNSLDFDAFPSDRRSWKSSADQKDPVYIAPVALAENHQLKEGFLVFGLTSDFFKFITKTDKNVTMLNSDLSAVYQTFPIPQGAGASLFDEDKMLLGSYSLKDGEKTLAMNSYFSPMSQLWIVNKSQFSATSFLGSLYFLYSLLGSLLITLLFLGVRSSMRPRPEHDEVLEGDLLPRISLKRPRFDLSRVRDKLKKQNAYGQGLKNQEVVSDFSEYLDDILEDEHDRLQKVGVSIQTHIEEDVQLMCAPEDLGRLLKRLIGNSVLVLAEAPVKEIQIRLIEESQSYQLIYVDTREDHFPSEMDTEGSADANSTSIDGIISHAAWLFGDDLRVAKEGFCLSVDFKKVGAAKEIEPEVLPFVETIDRLEINDHDEDDEVMAAFSTFAPTKKGEESAELERVQDNIEELNQEQAIDSLVDSFELKDFTFDDQAIEELSPEEPEASRVDVDEKGLFEFDTGQFKLKIRSPKKRDTDVDR